MTANTTAARDAVAAEVRAAIARRRGVSQVEIAKALGMSQSALSRRLVGELPFEIDVLFAIGKVLNAPLTELLPDSAAAEVCMNSLAMTFTAA